MVGKPIKIALAGNPNSGKTTVFNALTGSRQYVGNWPGVTVEKKEGKFRFENHEVTVVDLPGTYSLSAYSLDEKVARDFLVNEKPDAVVVVVDASNLERNLYLVAQLLELGAKVIVDLNMMDVAKSRGIMIDTQKLEQILGVKVVGTVASRGTGLDRLRRMIHDIRKDEPPPGFRILYGRDFEAALDGLSGLIEEHGLTRSVSARWRALKLLEGDATELKLLETNPDAEAVRVELNQIRTKLEHKYGYDVETAIVERRYGYLNGVVKECTHRKPGVAGRLTMSDKIDKVVTNRWVGIPIFLLLMWGTFQLVFKLGDPLVGYIEALFEWFGGVVSTTLASSPAWLSSLMVDGLINGIGSVLVFIPNIVILFLVISLLEDSGYMARAAFVMDRFMHALGLHGKSFIPMIIGFGCNVPAIMATRTLESRKDRILTILVNPLMSCSARLPIYTLFTAAFFSRNQGLVVFSLYLMGIVLAIAMARIFKGIFFKHEVAPLIMELPPYHLPSIRGVLTHMWERASLFVRKAGTIIAGVVVLVWLLASLPWGVEYASQASIIGKIGVFIAPIFSPAGFGNWQAAVSLTFGILAKEVVVGTMGTLYGVGKEGLTAIVSGQFTPLSAYAFMAMSLLYIPCIASIAAIWRETNWKWTLLTVGYTLVLGWLVAVLIYQVGSLLT
ncbi:ferrous iron transport protein B [candidate division WOR-3 bacterium JGI_Cruoil_03_51_56]|uniref:Ferrous iron transport protein B n=1 Tax=candidate division WOR-3 bacterium JGI_Cruoil_03_51_56 TaxID=1973747 RepID=A0A235BXD8_UNCW3|nr:MAG: ferrous iron transport protein B [candidate division WOR-3 bacterium JGI_Cruoil_03_51_56]